MKKVAQINKNSNEIICIFDNLTIASDKTNIDESKIIECCNKQIKSIDNYIFRYVKTVKYNNYEMNIIL